ncbi:MAG: ABC transporter permease [Lachnospiraceae bacterium]|nr:ABC transporter permease [Lachnospiraceae bacterium]
MKRLFLMECRKITRSVLYWLYLAALVVTVMQNYETTVENELGQTDNPASVFYIAENGVYAENTDPLGEDTEHRMMMEATKRLMENYRSNSYEYYPFGYVKRKKLSEKEQAAVLSYLKELTGLEESGIIGTEENRDAEDIQISGGGAFILHPRQGGTFGNGQFIAEPEDWEYVENYSGLSQSKENPGSRFEIQVPFDRFKEIMDCVNNLIGRNSYFSWTMLSMYYCPNDLQDTPITEQQHREFYEKDNVTGAFARYFCDSISLIVLCLPAFVMIDLLLKDKRCRMNSLLYPRTESSAKIIITRFGAVSCMIMLPILILPVKSLLTLVLYCRNRGIPVNRFAFAAYIFAWIFPTVLLVVSIALFVTVLTENYSAVLFAGAIWLFCRPSVDKLAGGNYGLFDLIIRHNTLKGYGRMMENMHMLILNRVLVSVIALLFVGFAIIVYDAKRKGGIRFESRKFFHNHSRKHSHAL